MEPRSTKTRQPAAGPRHRFINVRDAIYGVVTVWSGLMLCSSVQDAWALPTAEELLQELQISASDQENIRQGKVVKWTASEGSERELAVGMALLAKIQTENIVQLFRDASAFKVTSAIKAYGKISGEGSLADFGGVKLDPNGEKEAKRYLEAEPGEELNLDAKEIAAFHAIKANARDNAVPVREVEAQVRQMLLSRYQAYRAKGLSGITPYERKQGRQLRPSDELSLSTTQYKLIAKHLPSVYDTVLHYPAIKTTEGQSFEDQFYWATMDLFGRPTYILSHRMLFRIGEACVIVDRHFYASHDYNGMQQGSTALPTKDGMVVIYLGRVSTEQVAGFGSSMKHPVSRAVMSPYLEDMVVALRAKAEKP